MKKSLAGIRKTSSERYTEQGFRFRDDNGVPYQFEAFVDVDIVKNEPSASETDSECHQTPATND